MHIQAKATPTASPADLEALLAKLAEPGNGMDPINVEGVSGSHLETGGQLVFSFDHDRLADVRALLGDYKDLEIVEGDLGKVGDPPHLVGSDQELYVRVLDGNTPGQLLAAVRGASSTNLQSHRLIRHVVVGQETQAPNRWYVQIRFQEVKHP